MSAFTTFWKPVGACGECIAIFLRQGKWLYASANLLFGLQTVVNELNWGPILPIDSARMVGTHIGEAGNAVDGGDFTMIVWRSWFQLWMLWDLLIRLWVADLTVSCWFDSELLAYFAMRTLYIRCLKPAGNIIFLTRKRSGSGPASSVVSVSLALWLWTVCFTLLSWLSVECNCMGVPLSLRCCALCLSKRNLSQLKYHQGNRD